MIFIYPKQIPMYKLPRQQLSITSNSQFINLCITIKQFIFQKPSELRNMPMTKKLILLAENRWKTVMI
jgi:hypothetical protein